MRAQLLSAAAMKITLHGKEGYLLAIVMKCLFEASGEGSVRRAEMEDEGAARTDSLGTQHILCHCHQSPFHVTHSDACNVVSYHILS